MSRAAVDVTVHGSVQGVFFRDSCRSEAHSREVAGWVRNADDGTVQAHFEGESSAVDELVDWCRTGPARARVEGVEPTAGSDEGLTQFEVR